MTKKKVLLALFALIITFSFSIFLINYSPTSFEVVKNQPTIELVTTNDVQDNIEEKYKKNKPQSTSIPPIKEKKAQPKASTKPSALAKLNSAKKVATSTFDITLIGASTLPIVEEEVFLLKDEKVISKAVTNIHGNARFTYDPKLLEKKNEEKTTIETKIKGERPRAIKKEESVSITSPDINLIVTDIMLPKNGKYRTHKIVADVGQQEIFVNIESANGEKVICDKASLLWSHQALGAYTAYVNRNLEKDKNNELYANYISVGTHTLSLDKCKGHHGYRQNIYIGPSQNKFNITLNAK